MKKKFICTVCGYVYEGEHAPERCPQCGVPGSKFKEVVDNGEALQFITEHHIGDGVVEDAEVMEGLKAHFQGECTEVGMYLAMSRQADREGYPEIAEAFKRYAWEEAEHASKFAELLGEVVWDTRKTSKLVKMPNAVLAPTRCVLPNVPKNSVTMPFTIPYTKWPKTKLVTEKVSRVFTTVISRNNPNLNYVIFERQGASHLAFLFKKSPYE